MTQLKNTLSSLLLRYHRHPVLLTLGRLAYQVALTLACILFFNRRFCVTLFLRRGMTRKDWIPGGSDIDLTIILKQQSPQKLLLANRAIQRRIRLFNGLSPIPAEVGIFSESEFRRYREEGDMRSIEIASGWTVRRGAKPELARPREVSLAPLAYSEAFTQFGYLLALINSDRPLCRRLSRNLYKHYAEVLIHCEVARRDRYRYASSRWEALKEVSTDGRTRMATSSVLAKVHQGFAPADRQLSNQIFIDTINELDETARSSGLVTIEPAWNPIPERPLSKEISSLIEFWSMTASRLERHKIPVTFHHHRNTYLSLPITIFQHDAQNTVDQLLTVLTLKPIHGKTKYPVTEDILRVLSHCSCYLAYAFDIRGVRFDPTGGGTVQWFTPIISPWGSTSLKAKRSTIPIDMRRDSQQKRERVDWTTSSYLPRLERAITHARDQLR